MITRISQENVEGAQIQQSYNKSTENSRLQDISFEEIDNFLEASTNENTQRNTVSDMKLFKKYLEESGVTDEKKSTLSITKGPEFEKCRTVLQAKQKQLKSLGYGNKENASDELTDSDINKLYEQDLLGTHAPLPLTNLLYLTLTLVIGMRGGKEQRDLNFGDICIGVNS
ncbi:unnamed protein product [Mytilus coruscus]|uniref:Uncharacterized protein n=1 Tax=Mytilus coruscus TaxID=42192 RepID=A0A6J8DGV0_MYTCO|nr:unnamed protein product [Mytilus coruscus]